MAIVISVDAGSVLCVMLKVAHESVSIAEGEFSSSVHFVVFERSFIDSLSSFENTIPVFLALSIRSFVLLAVGRNEQPLAIVFAVLELTYVLRARSKHHGAASLLDIVSEWTSIGVSVVVAVLTVAMF